MEFLKLSVLAFALYAQLQTGVSSEDTDIWSLKNWQVSTFSGLQQEVEGTASVQSFVQLQQWHLLFQGDPAESVFTLRIDDLLKRSKSQQFHGLMGRSLGKTVFYYLYVYEQLTAEIAKDLVHLLKLKLNVAYSGLTAP